TVASFHPELMTEPLEETGEGTISNHARQAIEKLAEKKTVLAIGPGISRNEETAEVVRKIVLGAEAAVVLDADGLNAFEGKSEAFNRKDRKEKAGRTEARTLVLTPDPGEMSGLSGMSTAAIQRDRVNVARDFAQR